MKGAKTMPKLDKQGADWGMSNVPVIQPPVPPTSPMPPQPVGEAQVMTGYMPAQAPQGGYNQMISIGQASPHLPFRDWLARGVVSALGNLLAWPFRMMGEIAQSIAMAMIGILKVILMLVLIPSAIIIGLKIAAAQQEEDSIRGSAAAAVESVTEAGEGAYYGREDPEPNTQ